MNNGIATSATTYEQMLLDLAHADDRLMVLTAENRAAIRNLPERLGDRFVDVGICEQTMVGLAAGLALRGRIPVVHALATFLTLRAFEFIRTDVGIGRLPVKLVGAVPGLLSDGNGPTHQAIEDIALMRGIPAMRVFCPSDVQDLLLALPAIVRDPYPWYIRYNAAEPAVSHTPFMVGRAEMFGRGTDVALVTYGFLLRHVIDAATRLREQGVSVRVIHARTIKPVDGEMLLAVAADCRLIAVVEDHFRIGGLFSVAAELFQANRIAPRMISISLADRWFRPGRLKEVVDREGFSELQITSRIERALAVPEASELLNEHTPVFAPAIL